MASQQQMPLGGTMAPQQQMPFGGTMTSQPQSPFGGTVASQSPFGGSMATRTAEMNFSDTTSTTPKAWSADLSVQRAGKSSTVTYLAIGVVVAFALVVVVGVGYWEYARGTGAPRITSTLSPLSTSAKSPSPVATQPLNATVSVTIEGAPADAKVYFDGALISDNPFVVRREAVFLPLVIEAEGYEPYKIRISTDRDQSVRVSLKPVWRNVAGRPVEAPAPEQPSQEYAPVTPPVREVRRPSESTRNVPSRRQSYEVERPKSRLQKASRNAAVAEEFE
jgi:hypothetical protein